ncbi:MAG: ATP-dependent zinc metalloprotease FtsH [Clostridiales bacterium]|nr:ATP-dependent zinc metalloprotease FtsH [Clostridiales bacterium]
MVLSNNGYKGEFLSGGEVEIQQLIDGTHTDKEGKKEQLVEYYSDGATIYFLIENSKYATSFPEYSDYHYVCRTEEVLNNILDAIDAHNSKEGQTIFIKDAGIAVAGTNWWDIIYPVLYIGFSVFMVFMIFRLLGSSNKGAMNFGKSKARAYTTSKVRFNDIAGTEEEKEELKEIVEFLKAPKKFTDLGARIPKGVLLVGHPGTGKTLLARAVAGEANVPFISISGSDFVEMFVGVGASRVRDLFDQAKKNKPCIVFIDEIDAVGRQRGAGLGGGNDEREQTLNQLLVEMDGFEANEGIIVLAATNRSDVLDPALMRPGRFDRQIYVNIPDVKGREGILKIHARNKPLDESVDFATLAKITVGFTGADIENMLNEAAILAAREGRPKITMTDITEGINKVTMGPQKKSRLVTEKDRKITAYHESGHAILAAKLKHSDSVQEVSIIPRGMAGGYTMQRPENDNSYRSYNYLMDEIAVCMGGRIAEQIIFKDITTGASSDINQATKIARKMVYNYGMSKKLGFLSLDSEGMVFIGRDYQTKNDFSEKLAAEADEEVRKILNSNYERALKLLTENENLLHEMANLLLDQETINKEEVDMLLDGKDAEEIAAYMKERAEKQRAKEAEIKKAQEKEKRKQLLEQKVKEGEKLVLAGIITQEEFDAIKQKYQAELEEKVAIEEKQVEIKLNSGVSLDEKEEKPKQTRKRTTKKETTEDDDKGEDQK